MRFFIMIGCMTIVHAINPNYFTDDAVIILVVAVLGLAADIYELFFKDKE